MAPLIVTGIIVILTLVTIAKTIRIVPQAFVGIVERLGKFHKTMHPGLNVVIPYLDTVKPLIDIREQVVSFPPQPVITSDNLVVNIDSVIYYQVVDAMAATYEIANVLMGIEQLTITTLRNVIGSLDLEQTLTSRDQINGQLRGVLDDATGKWGIRVSRVELKSIDPPASVQQSMEKQMRAEREKRAAVLTAEGNKQAAILDAEGRREAAVSIATGEAKAQVLRAQGEAEAIGRVFAAIHAANLNDKIMAYQYLQTLPAVANGSANKVWMIPSEFTSAITQVQKAFLPETPK
jgi:regulator of protease activity HflC (stomatin/prohibitin superfamily)